VEHVCAAHDGPIAPLAPPGKGEKGCAPANGEGGMGMGMGMPAEGMTCTIQPSRWAHPSRTPGTGTMRRMYRTGGDVAGSVAAGTRE